MKLEYWQINCGNSSNGVVERSPHWRQVRRFSTLGFAREALEELRQEREAIMQEKVLVHTTCVEGFKRELEEDAFYFEFPSPPGWARRTMWEAVEIEHIVVELER